MNPALACACLHSRAAPRRAVPYRTVPYRPVPYTKCRDISVQSVATMSSMRQRYKYNSLCTVVGVLCFPSPNLDLALARVPSAYLLLHTVFFFHA